MIKTNRLQVKSNGIGMSFRVGVDQVGKIGATNENLRVSAGDVNMNLSVRGNIMKMVGCRYIEGDVVEVLVNVILASTNW